MDTTDGQTTAEPVRACEDGDAMERTIAEPWPGEEIRAGGRFQRARVTTGSNLPGSRRACSHGDAAERPIADGWPGSEVRIEGRFRAARLTPRQGVDHRGDVGPMSAP
jgi:hypothetical protein